MESQNSPTNTYAAPTCTLKVSSKAKQLSHLDLQQSPHVGNFVLEIDRPDRGELERTTLQGDLRSLEHLQLMVSSYIADLIANFPIPTTTDRQPPAQPQHLTEPATPIDRSVPTQPPAPPRSGLMQNLPGLRNSQTQPAPGTSQADRAAQSGHGKISKLIGFMHQHDRQNLPQSDLARSIPPNSVPPSPAVDDSETAATPKNPYLTGGNRSLDHQLHLGDLATPESGAVQILSAIQLFDLATVLDEYVATQVPTSQSGTKVHAQSLAAGGVKRADAEATAASLSRLPNLPRIPTEPEANPVYYRRRSRSGLMSAIPWAAAAALLVGAPLLLLGSGSNNSFQEWAGKLKMPNLLSSDRTSDKQTVGSRPIGSQPSNVTTGADGTVSKPSATLPKPWQAQSVQPPKNTPPTAAIGNQSGQIAKNNLGTTTTALPGSIAGTQAPSNPLTGGISVPSAVTTTPPVAAKPSPKIPTTPTGKTTPVASAKTNPTQSTKTTPKATNTGNISLSTQPILLPQDLPGDRTPTPRTNQTAIPPQNTPVGGGINPPAIVTPAAIVDPYTPKQVTNPSVKPKVNKSRPQASSSTVPFLTPSPTIEPKTYKSNPNLITPSPSSADKPVPPNNITGSESPTPAVVPDRPIQANNGQVGAEAIENPSLQEAKRYFQGKWKANPTQTTSLQYVLDVNGKNGVVRSVNPQGEAATDYLKQTKLIKPGQKIVSPVAGNSDQKIRVLLQPDGNVDTFIEP